MTVDNNNIQELILKIVSNTLLTEVFSHLVIKWFSVYYFQLTLYTARSTEHWTQNHSKQNSNTSSYITQNEQYNL
jgi:hypothetical protein